MEKDLEEKYQELLENSMLFSDENIKGIIGDRGGGSYDYDDDGEDFLTSKEIAESKKKMEDKPGLPPVPGRVEIEEDVHFKRYSVRREHKYTETELRNIRESCMCTIVHDYGDNDIYHMSDEERYKNDMLAEISMKLAGLKRTYRKVDQYIYAMRVVVEAWELLEKNNYVHTREEFFEMVAEGRIVSNRIIMPKLKKMDSYNLDTIIKYISNPELDPADLVPIKVEETDPWFDDFYADEKDDEEEQKEIERLLSPQEVQYILDNSDNPPSFEVKDIKRKYIKGYDRRNIMSKRRKMNKNDRVIAENLHYILNKIQNNPALNSQSSRSSMVTDSMFEQEKIEKNFWDDLYFDGSWASDDDIFIYDLIIREEILKQHPPKERYATYADKDLAAFFKILEDSGLNTLDLRRKMNSTSEEMQAARQKAEKKNNRKIENALIQRITQLNNDPKFKKLVSKAEEALNKYYEEY